MPEKPPVGSGEAIGERLGQVVDRRRAVEPTGRAQQFERLELRQHVERHEGHLPIGLGQLVELGDEHRLGLTAELASRPVQTVGHLTVEARPHGRCDEHRAYALEELDAGAAEASDALVERTLSEPGDREVRQRPFVLALDGRGDEGVDVVEVAVHGPQRHAGASCTYAASKAYLAILAESLWDELADDGIDVLGVLPGSTRTPGWLSSLPQSGMGTAMLMEPGDVVREALDALGTGVPTLVPGESNRESEQLLETMSRADAIRVVGQVMRDMYPDERDVDTTV